MKQLVVGVACVLAGMMFGAVSAEDGPKTDTYRQIYRITVFPQSVNLEMALVGIRDDICRDFVPVLNFKTCPFVSDWVSETDLDRDGVPEYVMRARAPWEGSGGSEVRIYRRQGATLERVYMGLAETVEPLYGTGKHKSGTFPQLLVTIRVGYCGRLFTFWDWSIPHYRKGDVFMAKLDHPDCSGQSDDAPPP